MEDIKVLLTQENPFLSKLEESAHAQAKQMGMSCLARGVACKQSSQIIHTPQKHLLLSTQPKCFWFLVFP